MGWNGAGGWAIFSHDRQVNFSRTVWDHLRLPGDHLQRLGDVLAQLDQLALAARADRGRWNDDALARQMRRQRRPRWLAAGNAAPRGVVPAGLPRRGGLGRQLGGTGVLGGGRLQLFELQFQLVEQPAPMLRGRPEPIALQLGDQELQMRHHRLGAGSPRLGLPSRRALGKERRFQRLEVVGNGIGWGAHKAIESWIWPFDSQKIEPDARRTKSAGPLRTEGVTRVPPVNPVKQVGELRRRDRNDAVGW